MEEVVVEPKKQAGILNDFYSSVFSRCDDDGPMLQKPENRGTLSDLVFNKECIISTAGKLRKDAAPGPDGIPNRLIIESIDEMATPLSILFSRSMEEAKIPDDWREATVTPIPYSP